MKPIRVLHILLICVLVLGSIGIVVPMSAVANIQPMLLDLAAENPDQVVSVIVQKTAQETGAEALVARLGGRVTADLSIISGFAAQVPANALTTLARFKGVHWVSYDAPVEATTCSDCIDTSNLKNAYIRAIRADKVWNVRPYLQGKGIGVAVIDSGICPNGDLYTVMGVNRQVADVRFNTDYNPSPTDGYGHGTHVSSVIGGDGSESGGMYIGVAPMVNIINVKVSNDDGSAQMQSVVSGLQWVLEHKDQYNIRVVNISLNSSVAESYNTSPLDAAVEILWFNGIVVVVSAGNNGSATLYPPANDPFVITVGAVDDRGTASLYDDVIPNFSAYGTSTDGFTKPDLVAPGKNIIARLVNSNMGMASAHPANLLPGNQYFRMSGTSVSAPVVAGAAAILLQDEPGLNPDQVKYRLMATANKRWPGYSNARAGAGYLDVYAAVYGNTTAAANTGTQASQLLSTGSEPITWSSVGWNSVGWNSVGWNSVGWNSVGWNSVGWNSVGWNSDYWGE